MWDNFNNPFQKYVESKYAHKKSEKKIPESSKSTQGLKRFKRLF